MFKVDSCTISISCMSLPLLLFPSLHFDGIALWGGMAWELGVREGSRYQTEVEFASRVNFSIFTHFLCFFSLKLLKLGEISLKMQRCKILDKFHICYQIGWIFGAIPKSLWTLSPHFWKIILQIFYNGYGRIYARRHRPGSIS